MYRLETIWHENSEKILGTGRNMWNGVILSFANIIVEVLKILLYITAVILDSIKPLTGTRKSAGIIVAIGVTILFIWNFFDVGFTLSNLYSGALAENE